MNIINWHIFSVRSKIYDRKIVRICYIFFLLFYFINMCVSLVFFFHRWIAQWSKNWRQRLIHYITFSLQIGLMQCIVWKRSHFEFYAGYLYFFFVLVIVHLVNYLVIFIIWCLDESILCNLQFDSMKLCHFLKKK